MAYISVSHKQTLIRLPLYQWTVETGPSGKTRKMQSGEVLNVTCFSSVESSLEGRELNSIQEDCLLLEFFCWIQKTRKLRSCWKQTETRFFSPAADLPMEIRIHLTGFDKLLGTPWLSRKGHLLQAWLPLLPAFCCVGITIPTSIAYHKCNFSIPSAYYIPHPGNGETKTYKFSLQITIITLISLMTH